MTNPRYISKVCSSKTNIIEKYYNKTKMTYSQIYSSPRRMPNIIPPIRMRPYFIPERSRTKSENAESSSSTLCQETSTVIESINSSNMMDICDTAVAGYDSITDTSSGNQKNNKKIKNLNLLKKSKSLEDIRPDKLEPSQQSHEMEFVSNRIQKLRVQD